MLAKRARNTPQSDNQTLSSTQGSKFPSVHVLPPASLLKFARNAPQSSSQTSPSPLVSPPQAMNSSRSTPRVGGGLPAAGVGPADAGHCQRAAELQRAACGDSDLVGRRRSGRVQAHLGVDG